MSHFSVLVPANNSAHLQVLMQPYHEFECTGEDDIYVQDVDVTKEAIENGLDCFGLEEKTVQNENDLDREGAHKYGYAIVDSDGNILKAINRTNPNKKWNWYEVGGRWSKTLVCKSGHRADYAKLHDIDFEAIRHTQAERAMRVYRTFQEVWETVAKLEVIVTDEDRAWWKSNEYLQTAFPAIEDMKRWEKADHRNENLPIMLGLDTIAKMRFTSADDYYQQHYNDAPTYAFISPDGAWHGRGDMGWWGMDSNRNDDYPLLFWRMIESIHPSATVFVVDCHI